jgi:exonuclease 3'-5' domain-containing protein 1
MGFSIDGGPFKDGLPYAHLKAGVTKVYELVKQTYPAKAQALEISFLDSAPDGKSRQERLKLLYPQTRSYTETLKVPESPKPKISWDKLDLPNKSTFVDTVEKLAKFLEIIQAVKDLDPDIFCDCEGDNLGRNGTFSLLQVMIAPKDHTWIIDITVLKDKAFDTRGPGLSGRTLREIMEDSQILKIFYDVRNDADAFFSHYKIYLRGIIDMQFMELAIRVSDRRRRVGLDTCMARVLMSKERMAEISMRKLDWDTAALWQYHKTAGQNYCKGEKGWAVYDERPLLPVLLRYAINDVVLVIMNSFRSSFPSYFTSSPRESTNFNL